VQDEADRRFLVDWMLMKLGRWLRLLGQDVALPAERNDERLMIQAEEEGRTIITRDKGLFLAAGRRRWPCLLIRANSIIEQLVEMECCQGEVLRWQCKSCKKIYWEGSHWKRMENMLENARIRRGST